MQGCYRSAQRVGGAAAAASAAAAACSAIRAAAHSPGACSCCHQTTPIGEQEIQKAGGGGWRREQHEQGNAVPECVARGRSGPSVCCSMLVKPQLQRTACRAAHTRAQHCARQHTWARCHKKLYWWSLPSKLSPAGRGERRCTETTALGSRSQGSGSANGQPRGAQPITS